METKLEQILSRYQIPILIIMSVIFLSGLGLYLFISNQPEDPLIVQNDTSSNNMQTEESAKTTQLTIHIAGGVKQSGVYNLEQGSRTIDAINLAGGFSETADIKYIEQTLNMAEILVDEQKIYIPLLGENNLEPNTDTEFVAKEEKVNVNQASQSELEALPGIGPVRAESIIQNRPYAQIEEITSKAGISNAVFEKIKNDISL